MAERLYYIRVALTEGDSQRVYGPFSSIPEAHAFGVPFAQEGFDVEARLDTPICDFCSDPNIAWSYAAGDFHIPDMTWGSRGGWAACETCHDFIEANDHEGLARHSVEQFFVYHKEIPDERAVRKLIINHVRQVHAEFFKLRKGEAQKGKEAL
jgi:hypothetical protein